MIDTCDEYLLNWSRYHDFLDQEFMWDLDQKSVVEIGAFTGAQTQIINQHQISKLTLVEPNTQAAQELKKKYSQAKVIASDVFEVYRQENLDCDVVVCLGLLYHLHSPFYLLENIVNLSNPNVVILDSVQCQFLGQGGLMPDPTNVPGNMFGNRKIVPYSVSYPFPTIDQAMHSLGYKLIKYHDLSQFKEIVQKSSCWMARWEQTT